MATFFLLRDTIRARARHFYDHLRAFRIHLFAFLRASLIVAVRFLMCHFYTQLPADS